jgi:AraC family transcriptional regulator
MAALIARSERGEGFEVLLRAYPEGYAQPMHAHDEGVVNIVLSGSVSESTHRTETRTGPLCLYIRPPGLMHANRYGSGTTRVLSIRFRGVLTSPGRPQIAHELRDLTRLGIVIALLREIHRATPTDPSPYFGVESLIALISEVGTKDPVAAIWRFPSGASITVKEMAARAGMHRVAFARSFRRLHGLSPSEYRRWSRVRAAAGRLGDASARLPLVALDAGFADQSHMCRDFQRVLGISPSRYQWLIGPTVTRFS